MTLTHRYLPEHHFAERHAIVIAADAPRILDTIAAFDPSADPLAARLIALREWPGRLLGQATPAKPPFGIGDFTPLGRTATDIAYGLAGRFWRLDFGLVDLADAQAFADLDRPDIARLVMSFETAALGKATRLVTRTRICCPDVSARRRLALYWAIIRPASGLIRRRMLGRIRAAVEGAA